MSSYENIVDARAKKMLELSDNENVSFIEFNTMISSKDYEGFIFCFVEGINDFKYYEPRIHNIIDEENVYVCCDGREKVINLFKMISNKNVYNKYRKGFFVDKDFNDEQLQDGIYQLPCYSIENLYCNEETLTKIIENNIGYKRHTAEHKAIIEQFSTTFSEVMEILRIFNNYAYYKKIKLNEPITLNDDKYSFKNMVIINDDYSVRTGRTINDNLIDTTIPEMFNGVDYKMAYRGKQQLDFLCKFLTILEVDLKKSYNVFTKIEEFKKPVGKLSLGNNTDFMLQTYSMFAITPPCLTTYIKNL